MLTKEEERKMRNFKLKKEIFCAHTHVTMIYAEVNNSSELQNLQRI